MRNKYLFLLIIILSGGWLHANHWTPINAEYADNTTLTGVIMIDGEEQYSDLLELGVFCGDECRGSQMASFFSPTQRYVVQVIIYGEAEEQFAFKLFDHERQQELDLNSPDAVSFTENGCGSLVNPYVLNFTSNGSQPQLSGVVIELTKGWNWISYLLPTETSIEEALANLTPEEGDMIKSQGQFRNFENGQWSGTLDILTPGKGYIYLREGEATSFTYPESGSKGLRVFTFPQREIRAKSALLQGEVISNGNTSVIVRGVCWSTNPNPTVEDNHTTDGYGCGSFTSTITDLSPNTTYYVRAYAMTLNGVFYGQVMELVTESMP